MAPTTTTTNWLSFSLSPMEMLRSSSDSSHFLSYDAPSAPTSRYLVDNFYATGWENPKPEMFFTGEDDKEAAHHQATASMADSPVLTTFIDLQTQTHHPIPKLEDFFGDSSNFRYTDSQTETQDSNSLSHIYDPRHHHHYHNSVYFNDQQDLKAITGFQQAFSTNSGSDDVDDSASIGRTQLTEFGGGHSIESVGNELSAFSSYHTSSLSLAVNNNNPNNGPDNDNTDAKHNEPEPESVSDKETKAIVAIDPVSNKKNAETFGQRTSIYRGVTRHRWTGRYEAHLWDNTCRREGQARKGRQVYLGGYDKEEKAARAYDLASLKYWGPSATINFPIDSYEKEVEEMKSMTKQEFIASLRRKSSGFSRGASIYRGVTRHHQQGRWQARIGRVAGNKDLYLGTFATEEEAAEAYDIAAIKFRGGNAVTNFEMNRYDVEAISQTALPVGGSAKRLRISSESDRKQPIAIQEHHQSHTNTNINFASDAPQPVSTIPCGISYETPALYHQNMFHHFQTPNVGTDSSGSNSNLQQPSQFFSWPHQSY